MLEHTYGIATSVARLRGDRSISTFDLTLSSKFLKVLPIQRVCHCASLVAHWRYHAGWIATHDAGRQERSEHSAPGGYI